MTLLDPSVLQRGVQQLFEPISSSTGDDDDPGRVGVELELFPLAVRRGQEFVPADKSGLELLQHLGVRSTEPEHGGRFSFEPGGQIEYSTPAVSSLAALLEDVRQNLDPLCVAAESTGMRLAASGLTPWYGLESVELRNPTSRYVEMDRYFGRTGPWGRWMMRHTASMQVNLDLGGRSTAADRWRVANALSPMLTAMFANSPADLPDGTAVASGRAWVWSQLDDSRTGIVGDVSGRSPAWAEYLTFALTARVMFDHNMRPVERSGSNATGSSVRFNDWWIEAGEFGPVMDDWHTHLSTLFPDVRPKRWLEIRAIDMPARPWWSVPPTLLAALLYDQRALKEVQELLSAQPGDSAALSAVACKVGMADPRIRDLATACFEICETAMSRFPTGWFGSEALEALSGFRERFIEPGTTQADEARVAGLVTTLSLQQPSTAASLPRQFS